MIVPSIRHVVVALFALAWVFSPMLEPVFGGTESDLRKIQTLYDNKEYQKALEEVAKLDRETSGAPDAHRLKIRTLLKLGNPKDALTEYDKLVQTLKHDDSLILREIALGFIVILTKDMREQMRGAAYTALKEWQSPDAIPFFEDGLSDGSGLVRAFAAEGSRNLMRDAARFDFGRPWKIRRRW